MESKLVDSFEEACELQGLKPENILPDCSKMPEKHRKAVIAFAKMCIVHESLNGDWKPDWNNPNQKKYYPWFDFRTNKKGPSGVSLSYNVYAYDYSLSTLGVRLFYKDSETAIHAGTQFIEFYSDMALIK